MVESIHTPGPWKSSGRFGNGHDTKWLIHHKSDGRDGGYFCEVVPLHVTAEAMATAEANVRLIAAAPDMLAALRAIAEIHPQQTYARPWLHEAIKTAQAAVAKATG